MKYILLLSIIIVISMLVLSCKSANWANKLHFKEQNKALNKPKPNENRVVFMGNSITQGWRTHHPEFFDEKPYINRGISGQTTDQMLQRFQQDVINLKPAVVVILAGTNDIAQNRGPITLEDITKNICNMVKKAKRHHIKVVLCSVLPAYDYPWRKGLHPNEKIPKLNTLLKTCVEKNNILYLDYFSAMSKENNAMIDAYSYDGVHPNKTGYKIMEPLVKKAIEQVLQ